MLFLFGNKTGNLPFWFNVGPTSHTGSDVKANRPLLYWGPLSGSLVRSLANTLLTGQVQGEIPAEFRANAWACELALLSHDYCFTTGKFWPILLMNTRTVLVEKRLLRTHLFLLQDNVSKLQLSKSETDTSKFKAMLLPQFNLIFVANYSVFSLDHFLPTKHRDSRCEDVSLI